MQRENTNIYQSARRNAGLTQEQAAELLDLSVESVKAYETGQRRPPDATVAAMAEAYRSPGLRLEHGRLTDELHLIPRDAAPQSVELATVRLCAHMEEWASRRRAQQLLQIAADGAIDETERPLFDEIVCELEGLASAWLSLKHCTGIKKERPELAGSKRSASQGDLGTTVTSIIPQFHGNASPNSSAGRAVKMR